MSSPQITVLIPVYGECPFVSQTLDSILAQSFGEYEVLIINDRASEDTVEVIKRFGRKFGMIRVLNSPGVGLVNALNYGVANSRSEYIARIDADDYMEPSRLTSQFKFLTENIDVAVVGSQMTLVNLDNRPIGKTRYPETTRKIRRVFNFQNCIGHPSVMYRRSAVLEFGGYDNIFEGAEDYELWSRISTLYKVCNLNSKLTFYRISSGQYSNRIGPKGIVLSELIRLKMAFPDEYQVALRSLAYSSVTDVINLSNFLLVFRSDLEKNGHSKEVEFARKISELISFQANHTWAGKTKLLQILLHLLVKFPNRAVTLLLYQLRVSIANFFVWP